MKLVKRVLPSGRVELTRVYYVVLVTLAVALGVVCAGLLATMVGALGAVR